jgi:hypothetical protein
MALTTANDMATPQILIDAIRGRFKGKKAFIGSLLVAQGAVLVSGTMPKGGQGAIGKTIEIPYWGTLGGFVPNPDGSAVTAQKLQELTENGTIARASLMVETSVWAQGVAQVDPNLGDPYAEGANQAMEAAEREMDRQIVAEAATTPLVHDISALSDPYLDRRVIVRAKTKWGDEAEEDVVAMVTHSQAMADLAELTDAHGRPLLSEPLGGEGAGSIRRLGGVPLLVSDKVPLTGSTMGTVAPTGSTPPVLTITGTPRGPYNLVIDCLLGGAHQTATIRFSVDGGATWSATLVTAAAAAPLPLVDTAVDSLIGDNGQTGLSVAFAAGTFNADNEWRSTANLTVSTLMLQKGAAGFWYNAARLGSKTDIDIATDSDLMAMHLYAVPKLFRRRRGGTRPGCIRIAHKVKNYIG